MLVLFSVGSSKGKWGTLLEALHEFKRLYDGDATVSEALPKLAAGQPRYANLTLRNLCDALHAKMRELDMPRLSQEAVSADPQPVLSPADAYQKLIRNEAELVPVSECANRISGVMLVPYPPGIPILMPGERMGARESAGLRYLLALEAFDRAFPGFEHEVHGIEHDDDRNFCICAPSSRNADDRQRRRRRSPRTRLRAHRSARAHERVLDDLTGSSLKCHTGAIAREPTCVGSVTAGSRAATRAIVLEFVSLSAERHVTKTAARPPVPLAPAVHIVEDDQDVREATARLLTVAGYVVQHTRPHRSFSPGCRQPVPAAWYSMSDSRTQAVSSCRNCSRTRSTCCPSFS